ncbi:MAG TPA: aldo/keto reductase [Actinomycetota bacterium]|nr:aldo/keto reductase [Actinomycetota bacterium]
MNRTVQLGDSDVPRIGLGTNRLTSTGANQAFIRAAAGEGLRHIDTAHLYQGGDSESAIGAAFGPDPDGVVVATKGGFRPGEGRPEVLRAQIEESLQRLGTDAIALYYLHRVDPQVALEESLGAIKECQDAGKVRHIGISEVSVEQIERAQAVAPIAAVQNHYNLSERKWDAVVDYCAGQGLVFVPYFPLHGRHPALARIAEAHGATETQIALAWLLHRSPTTLPIPGTLSVAHVRENLAALEIALSDEEYQALA